VVGFSERYRVQFVADSLLEEDGFELSVRLGGGGGSDDAVSGLERFSRFKTSKRPEQDRRGCGGQADIAVKHGGK
jgi:hypothetical protein